jgi:septal ring factor EnvC (AmiA/AmiB activator)
MIPAIQPACAPRFVSPQAHPRARIERRHLLRAWGVLVACLCGCAAHIAVAQAPGGEAVQAVFPDAERAQDEAARRQAQEDARAEAALKQRLAQMEKNIEQLERRMGRATQTPTTFNTLEKRMEDLQRRLDRLERDWNQRLRKLEDQVQRLERRSGATR